MSIDQEASAEMNMSWCERASTSTTELTLSGRSLNGEECRALSSSPLAECYRPRQRDAQPAIALSSSVLRSRLPGAAAQSTTLIVCDQSVD